ncbi:hypothetical protein E2562_026062 [Oryza meyeriana var. granulata]|uniref:Uncharacterized protein n=1 Tax=Oryza meyeriana var. granulata TaxID=110450 RepID=A0A6G1E488_9ORYZ|nr:hypothetical protein E2562_026062 [Oryza meyeriana var. granulata]
MQSRSSRTPVEVSDGGFSDYAWLLCGRDAAASPMVEVLSRGGCSGWQGRGGLQRKARLLLLEWRRIVLDRAGAAAAVAWSRRVLCRCWQPGSGSAPQQGSQRQAVAQVALEEDGVGRG